MELLRQCYCVSVGYRTIYKILTMLVSLLLHTSELVRVKVLLKKNNNQRIPNKIGRGMDLIGADLRDADLSGANLIGSIFLTQAQINSAKGDSNTKLPPSLSLPKHWVG